MSPNISLIEQAASGDGFVNFYDLLGLSPDAPDAQIQEIINALYQDAQTHRDHRVPARRREYGLLLEVLPQARTILLDGARRKRYNAYCIAVAMQSPRIAYPEFLAGLSREKEVTESGTDILTLRDLSRLRLGSASETPGALKTAVVAQPAAVLSEPSPAEGVEPAPGALEVSPPVGASPFGIFSLPAWCGGVVVLAGTLVLLPLLAQVPLLLGVPLSLMSGLVTAYVFSLADETGEPLRA